MKDLNYEDSVGESGEHALPSIMDHVATPSRFVDGRKIADQFKWKNRWKKEAFLYCQSFMKLRNMQHQ